VSLILPYTVIQKFAAMYSVNWLPISAALALVGIAVACRPWLPGRLSFLPWVVPASLVVAAVLSSRSATHDRLNITKAMNQRQQDNYYIVQQTLRHRAEFADADTVAIRGLDETTSPWCRTTGLYINTLLGKKRRWLLVVRPKSMVARITDEVGRGVAKVGNVEEIPEQELAAHPGIPLLRFDKSLNMTVEVVGKHQE
jgi:hypothetical protein